MLTGLNWHNMRVRWQVLIQTMSNFGVLLQENISTNMSCFDGGRRWGVEKNGGALWGRPKPTQGCSTEEEEEEDVLWMKVKYFAVHGDLYACKQYVRVTTFTRVSESYLLQILLNVHVFPCVGPTCALSKSSFPVTNSYQFHTIY
jgi:hypothetical protein